MKKKVSGAVSAYLAGIGRKGGRKRVAKGLSKLPPERRREIARKAAAARWERAKKAE